MDERKLRGLIGQVKSGRMSRRRFVQMMVGAGLTVPMAGQMLLHSGVANAQQGWSYKPAKRGGGGQLKLLMWQGPTLLNPHFAVGTKDQYGCRVFYEPLAAWDGDGNLIPILAAEVPKPAADGRSVVWKLKKGVTFHDGKPFTADDVIFNWEYAADPAVGATTSGSYKDIKAIKLDSHTVRVEFAKPTPYWADPFVGVVGMMIPKHLFQDFRGAKAREAPTNLKPVGTACYKFADFRPGDHLAGTINMNYHENNRPYFDSIEMKGGGDAVSAARAVLQTGEFDYAWNMQVEDEILKRLEAGGKGKVLITPAGSIEMLQMQNCDPWTEVEGERAHIKTKHPTLGDPAVREALSLLVDRKSMQEHIYGRTGIATANFLNQPSRYGSKNTKFEFNPDKAADILEKAGWKKGSDGIREKGGKKLKYVYQTSINAPRQKCQAIVKQACQKAGIDLELKSVAPAVFFSSDEANPDTDGKFYADLQMYTLGQGSPDPHFLMNSFCSWEISAKANKWQGRNRVRWRSDEYDRLYREAEVELDPVRRAALYIRMNDLVVASRVVIPVVNRNGAGARSNRMRSTLSGWDNTTWLLKDWYREG